MEDIASLVVTSFSATIHSEVLLKAAEHGIALIYCRKFKPVSIVLPANRSTDTTLTRSLLDMGDRFKHSLWRKTIDAKSSNQYALAAYIAPGSEQLPMFRSCLSGIHPRKEAACARYFWRVFGTAAGNTGFTRDTDGGGLNVLLNFGYAILLSMVLRNLFAVGLDPTFGIFHMPRERATPLAYDIMEPFRPCVDARVFGWIEQNPSPLEWRVSTEFKKWMIPFSTQRIPYLGKSLRMQHCLERVVRSFRASVIERRVGTYKPWILRSLRWDGC